MSINFRCSLAVTIQVTINNFISCQFNFSLFVLRTKINNNENFPIYSNSKLTMYMYTCIIIGKRMIAYCDQSGMSGSATIRHIDCDLVVSNHTSRCLNCDYHR